MQSQNLLQFTSHEVRVSTSFLFFIFLPIFYLSVRHLIVFCGNKPLFNSPPDCSYYIAPGLSNDDRLSQNVNWFKDPTWSFTYVISISFHNNLTKWVLVIYNLQVKIFIATQRNPKMLQLGNWNTKAELSSVQMKVYFSSTIPCFLF